MNKSSPSMAVFGEVGDKPLHLKAFLTMLKFWNRIRHMSEDTLVKNAYEENVKLNTNWCKTIQRLNTTYNLHTRDLTEIEFPRAAKKKIHTDFLEYWDTRIKDRNVEKKLEFYAAVKQEFGRAEYLNLPSFRDRQRISKFFCSDHHLEIERGKTQQQTKT